jgi:hypothetical protein
MNIMKPKSSSSSLITPLIHSSPYTTHITKSRQRESYHTLKSRVFLWHKNTASYRTEYQIQSAAYFEDIMLMTYSMNGCVERVFDMKHDPYQTRNLVLGNHDMGLDVRAFTTNKVLCKVNFETHSLSLLENLIDRGAAMHHCEGAMGGARFAVATNGNDPEVCMAKYHRSVVTKLQVMLPKLKAFVLHGNEGC